MIIPYPKLKEGMVLKTHPIPTPADAVDDIILKMSTMRGRIPPLKKLIKNAAT